MKTTTLRTAAWIGLVFMSLSVLIALSAYLVAANQRALPLGGGYGAMNLSILLVPVLDMVGLPLVIWGGFDGKPRYFWQASLAVGILYSGAAVPWVVHEIYELHQTHDHLDSALVILSISIVPAVTLLLEGIILREIERTRKG